MSEVLTPPKIEQTHVLDLPRTSDTDNDGFSGWFCIKTNPWPCACGNFTANHITVAHLIIVWPSMDDRNLLDVCVYADRAGRNPKVLEYEEEFGPCVSYYKWQSDPTLNAH